MRNLKIILAILTVTLSVMSCKKEAENDAEVNLEKYRMYIDSIEKISEKEAIANLELIDIKNIETKTEAEVSIEMSNDKEELSKKLNEYSVQYDKFRSNIIAEKSKIEATSGTSKIRMSLLGSAAVGNDMKFTWVNKDNILKVYDNFISTVQKNKEAYSREDWDEIKLLYEALDTRKNTVEKEGLSGEDNRKIAGLKLKFAPMYTLNRTGSKSEENSDAKK